MDEGSPSVESALKRLSTMRPTPSFYIAHGSTTFLRDMFTRARALNGSNKLVRRDSRWNLVTQDWQLTDADITNLTRRLDTAVSFLRPVAGSCCPLIGQPATCPCSDTTLATRVMASAGATVARTLKALPAAGVRVNCAAPPAAPSTLGESFSSRLADESGNSGLQYDTDNALLYFPLVMNATSTDVADSKNQPALVTVGIWNSSKPDGSGFTEDPTFKSIPIKRSFRVGIVARDPWTMTGAKCDALPTTAIRATCTDQKQTETICCGYCVEMVDKIKGKMKPQIETKLILSDDFGHKNRDTGSWNGVVGDLVSGEVDIVVAAMTMTSEREEVIDFVAPYFEQSGISIIIRKPVREQSLFKFMQVARRHFLLSSPTRC
jgi:ABC-type amino acid transport substrate-binding protein